MPYLDSLKITIYKLPFLYISLGIGYFIAIYLGGREPADIKVIIPLLIGITLGAILAIQLNENY
jgi:hypothetical protein